MNKSVRNISIFLIVLVIAALLIVPKLLSEKNKTTEGPRQNPQDQVISADAFVIKPIDLENDVSTVGTILANEEVEIKSELTRKITGIYFKEGTYVPKGKVLFRLDDSDLLASLNKLELDEQLMMKQQDRDKQLLDKGLLTPDQFDTDATSLEKVRADMDLVDINIDKTYIRAPFSGIVGFRNVSNGSLVSNTMVLTTIQDIAKVKVDFSIPERYMSLFKPGQKITFSVEGYDDEFSGTVISYDPKLNEATRTIILRASADNKGNRLLPGSFVKVRLKLDNIPNAIMLPSESIIPKLKGQSVFVYRNGIASLIDVETGLRTEKDVQITSNLAPGDTVITTNILKLKNDSKVKLVNVN